MLLMAEAFKTRNLPLVLQAETYFKITTSWTASFKTGPLSLLVEFLVLDSCIFVFRFCPSISSLDWPFDL